MSNISLQLYLSNYNTKRIVYNLNNIKNLIKESNIDLSSIKFIHITGSKGKGSTAFYINEFLQSIGLKTGLYTSPHILKVNERIKVNNIDIPDKILNEIFDEYKDIILKIKPTYFELLTFIALIYFKYEKVDWAVLEVGLGGRLDATNVINSFISVITGIELEHQSLLGNTKLKILKEKAEIIKNNSFAVVNIKEQHLIDYLLNLCHKRNTKLYNIGTYNHKIKKIHNNIFFHKSNIAIALQVILILNEKFSYKFNDKDIQNIIANKSPFGRFSIIKKFDELNVFVDVAHTNNSIKLLFKTLKQNNYKNPLIIFNCLSDKNFSLITKTIKKYSSNVIILKLGNNNRELDFNKLKNELLKNKLQCIFTDTLNSINFKVIAEKNYKYSYNANFKYSYDVIIAFGSFYLIEKVIRYFNENIK